MAMNKFHTMKGIKMKKLALLAFCLTFSLVGLALAQQTVSVWVDDNEENQCILPIYERFNDMSETAQIEITLQAESWDVTRTALAGGAGPDVVTTPGPSFVFELAQAGLLEPLVDYAADLNWSDSFVDWALSLGEVEGTLYSLPTELETIVLYYNKTLFADNGWNVPTTIDELMAVSEEIAAAGINPYAHGNAEWRPANEWFASVFFNHVAGPDKVYEALRGDRPWTDPDFVKAMSLLDDIQQNGWFSGGLDYYYTATFPEIGAALGNGEGAMNIEGSWRLSNIDSYFGESGGNDNDWDWVAFPTTSGEETYSIGIGSTFSVNALSESKDGAAEFLTFLFSPETQAELAVSCGRAPAPVRISADLFEGLDPRNARLFESIGKASDAGNYGYLTWTFWPPKSDVHIYEAIELVWDGQTTVEEYLDGLDTIFAEELESGDIPPIPNR